MAGPGADQALPPGFAAHVAGRFPLRPVPSVPEVRLHTAEPASQMWRLAEMAGGDLPAPYWSTWWGGGIALARHVLDRPDTVAGRRVLDLGTGSGLVAIAAALAGARSVLAADVDRYALAVARMNAAANGVEVEFHLGDLTAGAPPGVEVALVGDLYYEAALATRVTAFLDRCLAAGIRVLVGDPGRSFLPRSRLSLVAEYGGPEFARWPGRNAVHAFGPAS